MCRVFRVFTGKAEEKKEKRSSFAKTKNEDNARAFFLPTLARCSLRQQRERERETRQQSSARHSQRARGARPFRSVREKREREEKKFHEGERAGASVLCFSCEGAERREGKMDVDDEMRPVRQFVEMERKWFVRLFARSLVRSFPFFIFFSLFQAVGEESLFTFVSLRVRVSCFFFACARAFKSTDSNKTNQQNNYKQRMQLYKKNTKTTRS